MPERKDQNPVIIPSEDLISEIQTLMQSFRARTWNQILKENLETCKKLKEVCSAWKMSGQEPI